VKHFSLDQRRLWARSATASTTADSAACRVDWRRSSPGVEVVAGRLRA
jgi:hypothetical protein